MIRLNGENMRGRLTKLLQEHQKGNGRKKRKQVKKNGKVS